MHQSGVPRKKGSLYKSSVLKQRLKCVTKRSETNTYVTIRVLLKSLENILAIAYSFEQSEKPKCRINFLTNNDDY